VVVAGSCIVVTGYTLGFATHPSVLCCYKHPHSASASRQLQRLLDYCACICTYPQRRRSDMWFRLQFRHEYFLWIAAGDSESRDLWTPPPQTGNCLPSVYRRTQKSVRNAKHLIIKLYAYKNQRKRSSF